MVEQLPEHPLVLDGRVGRILSRPQAAELLGVSVATLKRGEGRVFPAPVRISEGRVGFLEAEILRWQQTRVAERDRGAA